MRVSVIICAAGKGERAGFNKNKLLTPLYGAPALWHTLKGVSAIDGLFELIIASSPRDMAEITAICAPFGGKVVEGGATRTESVYKALKHVSGDIVLILDGARPFTTKKQYSDCIECVKEYGSAVVAMPATDTIYLENDGWAAHIPERSSVFAVQTPQGFFTKDIKAAYEKAIKSGETFTDDGSVYSRFIKPVRICPCGSSTNKKLTYKEDFPTVAEINAEGSFKAGVGIDIHAFGKEQNFVMLCGVKVPCDCGLIAHSDGDVALHAVCDAILSAAGMRDIGYYFPDNDPALKEADSAVFLKTVVNMIYENERNYKVESLSVAIQAEKPRLGPYIEKMKERLSKITGADKENIGISAGTCEGLGFVGEKRGICVYCVAVLKR